MSDELERLVETLLWEGYALYPYTPGAIKNSTPTPFGIVYPPEYAADSGATHDIARLECVAEAGPEAAISASVRFLEGSGETHQAQARRIDLDAPGEAVPFAFDGLEGRVRLRVEPADEPGRVRVAVCVHNTTDVARGLSALGGAAPQPHVLPRDRLDRGRAVRLAAARPTPRRSTPIPCSWATPTSTCSARRSCCPTIRSSRPRARRACSTARRSRRR